MNKTLGQVARESWWNQPIGPGFWDRLARAVVTAYLERRDACDRCEGTGKVSKRRGTSYETDTAEERAANWVSVKCPRCSV